MTLTTSQAAKILDTTPVYVAQLCAAGKIKATKVGRDWLMSRRAVDAYKPRKPGCPVREQLSRRGAGGGRGK